MNGKLSTRELVWSALFSALIAVGAFIKIPLGVVPMTLQLFFVILSGLLLGAKLGFMAVFTYVVIGLLGIPVFVHGGGIGYILQPTFGYILGFCLAALVSGLIVEKSAKRTLFTYLVGGIAGALIIYLIGVIYFYFLTNFYLGGHIAMSKVIVYCWLIFVPNDLFCLITAALLARRLEMVCPRHMHTKHHLDNP